MSHTNLTIADAIIYTIANSMIELSGEDAVLEAAEKADLSRSSGNVIQFVHWRQVEQAIQILQLDEVIGELH